MHVTFKFHVFLTCTSYSFRLRNNRITQITDTIPTATDSVKVIKAVRLMSKNQQMLLVVIDDNCWAVADGALFVYQSFRKLT